MRWPLLSTIVIAFPLAVVQVAFPQTLRLEAEDFIASHNIGGGDVYIRSCSAASGGYAVDGLDREGEWIQLALELSEGLCFVDSLRSAGSLGTVRTYAIHIERASPSYLWAADTVSTIPGSGIT